MDMQIEQVHYHKMKIFVAGGTGAIGRPLLGRLLAKGHAVVALMRSTENAQDLIEQGIEPAIADVFDPDAVKSVVARTRPELVIEQLTALPRTYTRKAMMAAAPLNTRIRLEGGANVLAAALAAGVRRYVRQSIASWAVPDSGLADEQTPPAYDMDSSMDQAPGSAPMAMLAGRCDSDSSRSLAMARASGRGYTLRTRQLLPRQRPSKAILAFT
jgi:nucleoside-diphosphate-sugar epimerase